MGTHRGYMGLIVWSFIFLFPFAVTLLANMSARAHGEVPPALWPLIFFYGAAAILAFGALFLARVFFRIARVPQEQRTGIVKGIFLLPLLPGVAYLAVFMMRLAPIVSVSPNQPAAAASAAPKKIQTPAPTSNRVIPMHPPTITLLGDAAVEIAQGAYWSDPGAIANDSDGTDLTDIIAVTGSVNLNKKGLYTLVYSVVDKAGNSASVSRVVYISSPTIQSQY